MAPGSDVDVDAVARKALHHGIGALTPEERRDLGPSLYAGRPFPVALPRGVERCASAETRAVAHQRLQRHTSASASRHLQHRQKLLNEHALSMRICSTRRGTTKKESHTAMQVDASRAKWSDRVGPGEGKPPPWLKLADSFGKSSGDQQGNCRTDAIQQPVQRETCIIDTTIQPPVWGFHMGLDPGVGDDDLQCVETGSAKMLEECRTKHALAVTTTGRIKLTLPPPDQWTEEKSEGFGTWVRRLPFPGNSFPYWLLPRPKVVFQCPSSSSRDHSK